MALLLIFIIRELVKIVISEGFECKKIDNFKDGINGMDAKS